jgi:hypothetical protein
MDDTIEERLRYDRYPAEAINRMARNISRPIFQGREDLCMG